MAKERKREGRRSVRADAATVRELEWRGWMQQWEKSGLTQAEFCRRQSLVRSAFAWWRCELKRRDERRRRIQVPKRREVRENASGKRPPSFLPVEVIAPVASSARAVEIVLRNERRIRVGADFDSGTLEKLIDLLERMA